MMHRIYETIIQSVAYRRTFHNSAFGGARSQEAAMLINDFAVATRCIARRRIIDPSAFTACFMPRRCRKRSLNNDFQVFLQIALPLCIVGKCTGQRKYLNIYHGQPLPLISWKTRRKFCLLYEKIIRINWVK